MVVLSGCTPKKLHACWRGPYIVHVGVGVCGCVVGADQ